MFPTRLMLRELCYTLGFHSLFITRGNEWSNRACQLSSCTACNEYFSTLLYFLYQYTISYNALSITHEVVMSLLINDRLDGLSILPVLLMRPVRPSIKALFCTETLGSHAWSSKGLHRGSMICRCRPELPLLRCCIVCRFS